MATDTLDLNALRKSWDDVKNLEAYKEGDLGVNMMVKIFTRNLNIKHLWKFAADLNTESEIRAAPSVKMHGRNVMRSVNALIEKLDNITDAQKFLYDLGVRHIRYGSKEEHLPIIGGALLETIIEGLGDKYDKEAEAAWRHAINFVAINVSRGLKEEQ